MSVIALPTPVTVTNKISRIQPYVAPYLIINQNLFATVWAANNAGLSPGGGTPIPPGTSVPWTSSGDIFFVLGNDAPSVAQGSAAIIISYDASNWVPSPVAIATAILNAGVLIIDQPVTILNTSGTAGSTSGPFDVSKYQSLEIAHTITSPTSALLLTINFYSDAAATTLVKSIPVNWSNSGVAGLFWRSRIPVHASYVTFVITEIFGNWTLSVVASNRSTPQPFEQQVRGAGTGVFTTDHAILDAIGTLPSGNNIGISTIPWFGLLYIEAIITGFAASGNCLLDYDVLGANSVNFTRRTIGKITLGDTGAYQSVGVDAISFTVPSNGNTISFVLRNTDLNVISYQIRAMPIPPY